MEILSRIWEGNLIYKEPVCFSEDAKGHSIGGNLLYQPTQILSVTYSHGEFSNSVSFSRRLLQNFYRRS